MRRFRDSYLSATRHPWPCLLFLLPLLTAYEAGVIALGGTRPEAVRNGADTWLRWGLEACGLPEYCGAPVLVLVVLFTWTALTWPNRPILARRVCVGMALESSVFAVGLWGLSRILGPLLDDLGVRLSIGPLNPTLAKVVTYMGAGIYEEILFRLVLFVLLGWLLRLLTFPALPAALLTLIASALVFAAAHHLGPYGEPFDGFLFLFRALAGLYFALLYQLRGFGVAVGTHACYDVLVGVLMM
jgi:hypothetical protein